MSSAASFWRRLSPGLFLLGIALALAAMYQAYATVRSHRETSARLVRDYGAFAAWSYRQHATETLLMRFRLALGSVVHIGKDGSPPGSVSAGAWRAGQMADTSAPCRSACKPSYHFRFPLRDLARAEFVGDVPDARIRDSITHLLGAHARTPARPSGDFTTVRARLDDRDRLIAYALVDTRADHTVAYGFELDPAQYEPLFASIFAAEELLPRALTGARANSDLLGVHVRAVGAKTVFASTDTVRLAQPSTETLGEQLGGLIITAGVLDSAVGSLTGGAMTRARLPLLVGLLALSVALAMVAIYQMRRDAELARMRSDFVSSVSHELRTPLAQVQLFLETLRLGRHRTDEQREWIFENMQREVTRLTALVNNVLHFARAERGAVAGTRELTMLEEYLGEVVRDFMPLAASRHAKLETRFAGGARALVHRESFRQVILNLLDNAVKYGPPGQTVSVATALGDDTVRICVEDEGPGVHTSEHEVIFEPFHRGKDAIGSVAVGSGIGLSVVREIVEWHKGTIRAENRPGRGARFVIELPRAAGSVEQVDTVTAGNARGL